MRKKIIILIIIAAAALIGGLTIFNIVKENNRKSNLLQANDRLLLEIEYMDNLAAFVDQADDVTAAYVSGQIDKGAYLDRHKVLVDEYTIIKNQYTAWLAGHPIETGSESYVSKRGEQAVEKTQNDIDGLLQASFKNENELYDIYELYYRYLAQKEEIRIDYLEFTVAYRWIKEADTIEQDVDAIMEEFEARKEQADEERRDNGQEENGTGTVNQSGDSQSTDTD